MGSLRDHRTSRAGRPVESTADRAESSPTRRVKVLGVIRSCGRSEDCARAEVGSANKVTMTKKIRVAQRPRLRGNEPRAGSGFLMVTGRALNLRRRSFTQP